MPFLFFFILVEPFAIRTCCHQKWSAIGALQLLENVATRVFQLPERSPVRPVCWCKVLSSQWEPRYQTHLPTGNRQFASSHSGAEQNNVYLIWKVESWIETRTIITLHLSSFSLRPEEFCFSSTTTLKALASLTATGATVLSAVSSFWGFLVPGLVWHEDDHRVTEDAHPTHCYRQSYHKMPTLALRWWERKDWLGDSTPSSVSAGFDAQNEFLWGMQISGFGHWAKISTCGFLHRVPCSKYKPVNWPGKSGWLQECPGPPFCSTPKEHRPNC